MLDGTQLDSAIETKKSGPFGVAGLDERGLLPVEQYFEYDADLGVFEIVIGDNRYLHPQLNDWSE